MNISDVLLRLTVWSTLVMVLIACQQDPEQGYPPLSEQESTPPFQSTQDQAEFSSVEVIGGGQITIPVPTDTPTLEPTDMPTALPTLEPTVSKLEEPNQTGGLSPSDDTDSAESENAGAGEPDTSRQDEYFDLYAEAEKAYQLGNYDKALELIDQLLNLAKSINDESLISLAFIFRGDTYDSLQNYSAAIADYEQALAAEGDYPAILNNLCWWYGMTEQPQDGLPYCEQIAADGRSANLDSRGLVRAQMGDIDGAISDFQAVIDSLASTRDPQLYDLRAERRLWVAMLNQGQTPFVPAVMANLRQNNPLVGLLDPDVEGLSERPLLQALRYYWLGRDAFEKEEYEVAKENFSSAVEIFPQFQEAYAYRGDTFLFEGNLEEAIADYSLALQLDPLDPLAYYWRATAYQQIDAHQQAIQDYSDAIAISESSGVYYGRGVSRMSLGDFEGALEDFDQAYAFDPDDALVLWKRGVVRGQLGDLEAAIREIEEAVAIGLPPDSAALARQDLVDFQARLQEPATATPEPTKTKSAAADALLTPVPTATSMPLSAVAVINIAADGSGDYESLADGINAAPAGATILIGPGIYQLQSTLEIDKAIHLVGAGMDQTEILSSASNAAVFLFGDGPFLIEDISFRHEGEDVADVVIVVGGEVTVVRSRFAGGLRSETGGGSGLVLINTTGYVRESVASDNEYAGISILTTDSELQTHLERNSLNDNEGGSGIVFAGLSMGSARENECSRNLHGIVVTSQAKPTLERNVCRENSGNGLLYSSSSGGTARENDLSENLMNGVDLGDQAQPNLEANLCSDNGVDGIAYYGASAGTAEDNQCNNNGKSGIAVREDAQPTLTSNMTNHNKTSGISYLENASGLAAKNTCSNNEVGLWVDEESSPTLEENTCKYNATAGIYYWLNAGGFARMNELTGNGMCIYVPETADPVLENNNCYDNIEAEIVDERE